MDLNNLLDVYTQAWMEPDEAARLTLLETAWAADGLYQDPTGEAQGRAALTAHIGGFQVAFPGARLEMTTGVDAHHDRLRFGWRMVQANGTVMVEGIDCGRVGADGRLVEIIGFFGASPPAA